MTPKQYARAQELIRLFVGYQRELFELSLHCTAAKMGDVNERIGWELAERREQDGRFSPRYKRAERKRAKFLASNPHIVP
jgi:hypothetical protein